MKHSRKLFLGAGAASYPGLVKYAAGAAEFAYKLATDLPASHPITVHVMRAIDSVKRETGGRLEVSVFPNSMLGGQAQLIDQTRLGAVDMLLIGSNVFAGTVPVSAISGVPFAFATNRDAWNAMDGALGRYIRTAFANAKTNLHTFEKIWDSGFKQLSNNVRPLNAPDDLKGLKLRIAQAPMPIAMFKTLGASPTPVSAAEQYTALQTHLVDGVEASLSGIESEKLYEVIKYASITNHAWTGYLLSCNLAAWDKLPKNLQDTAERVFGAEAVVQRNEMAGGDTTLSATLKGQNMALNQANIPAFRGAVSAAGLYGQWRDSFGTEAWALLERTTGKLA